MTLTADVQKLEPGAEVVLWTLDASQITGSGSDVIRFHGYQQAGPIIWQGNAYDPWPIDAEGFELNPSKPPVPTLSVGNVDGSITALCLNYQDLVGAKLTRHVTAGQYLDGQPDADPTQESVSLWLLEQKTSETSEAVVWSLSSAMDFGQVQLPRRQIVAGMCLWLTIGGYRGPYCGYNGPPVADENGDATSDPAKDKCGGKLADCKLRFGDGNPLPFGGFPAAGLLRR